jgi:transcriptional regulator with XRE-family HTH domain
MKISQNSPIESLLNAIGSNLTSRTKQAGLKKQDLAALADVSQNTITSILSGGDMKVSTLIRLTRALNSTEWLSPLIDEPAPSPLQQLRSAKRRKSPANLSEKPATRPMGRNQEALK